VRATVWAADGCFQVLVVIIVVADGECSVFGYVAKRRGATQGWTANAVYRSTSRRTSDPSDVGIAILALLVDAIKLCQGAVDCEVSQCFEAFVATANNIDEAPVCIILVVEDGAHGLE
jgi:hypothetical protein